MSIINAPDRLVYRSRSLVPVSRIVTWDMLTQGEAFMSCTMIRCTGKCSDNCICIEYGKLWSCPSCGLNHRNDIIKTIGSYSEAKYYYRCSCGAIMHSCGGGVIDAVSVKSIKDIEDDTI